jgi:hypothetical protein
MMTESMVKVNKIKKLYEEIWLELDNVTAVGSGKTKDGRICLVISLNCDDPATRDIFPREIEDIPIEFRISGGMDAC